MTFSVALFCARGEIQSSTHRRSSINHSKRTKTLQSVGCSGKGVNHEEKETEATQSSAEK